MKKNENISNEQIKKECPIYMTDARGFVYLKEDQSSSLISPEEREAWLDSLK